MRRALAGLTAALAIATAAPALAQEAAPAPAGPKVDGPGKLPEPAPSVPELAYDSRLLSSFASAERFQGALDGGWTLSADGQGDLYAFQLVDRREGLEGAWRDLRRPRQPGASGFVDQMQRTPAELVLRFSPAPQQLAVVTLRPAGGALRGELDQTGQRIPVTLRKTSP
ncbi:MAG: hypothetical protein JWQ97_3895 [Phenylobacterium sp.]|nr:hypothetical protein [Phenylobacterium sp.]